MMQEDAWHSEGADGRAVCCRARPGLLRPGHLPGAGGGAGSGRPPVRRRRLGSVGRRQHHRRAAAGLMARQCREGALALRCSRSSDFGSNADILLDLLCNPGWVLAHGERLAGCADTLVLSSDVLGPVEGKDAQRGEAAPRMKSCSCVHMIIRFCSRQPFCLRAIMIMHERIARTVHNFSSASSVYLA